MKISRKVAATAAATLLAAGLASCSDGDDAPETAPTQSDAPSSEPAEEPEGEVPPDEDPETDEPSDADESADGPAAGSSDTQPAEWASEFEIVGDLLTTVESDGFSIDIYQVGVEPSPKKGSWVDPDTNKPIIDVGTDLVFLNYVITNVSDEEKPMTNSLVSISARYDDWPWAQGMGGITDYDLLEELGLNTREFAQGSGDAPFMLAPGEQYATNENFNYQKDSPITFDFKYTPANEDGSLNHDERVEFEGTAVIK